MKRALQGLLAALLVVCCSIPFGLTGWRSSSAPAALTANTEAEDAEDAEDRTVWIVSVPGLSFMELESDSLTAYPHLRQLLNAGGIGAMNIRTAGNGAEDVYMSMAAASPAAASAEWNAYGENEQIGEERTRAASLYYRYTGRLSSDAALVIPLIEEAFGNNDNQAFDKHDGGLLGDVLKRNGLSIAVYGNRDRGRMPEEASRHLALLLTPRDGLIMRGDVSANGVIRQSDKPFGLQANMDQWRDWIRQSRGTVGVAAFEWGDIDRLFGERNRYAAPHFRALLSESLLNLDIALSSVMRSMREQDVLYVLSPSVHAEARANRYLLAPLIRYAPGLPGGLLASGTTKRAGIVSMYDIAPAILRDFALDAPEHMLGQPLEVLPQDHALKTLEDEYEHIRVVYEARPDILIPFASYAVIVMLGSLAAIWMRWRRPYRWLPLVLYSVLAAPAAFLLTPLFPYRSVVGLSAWFLVILAAFSSMLARMPLRRGVTYLGIGSAVLILLDAWGDAWLMKHSVFGYDVMIGARYYGIGNEYMGVLIAAFAIGCAFMMPSDARPNRLLAAWIALGMAVLFVYMASPGYGTNAGGALTASVTFGIAWYRWFAPPRLRRMEWRRLVAGIAALIVLGLCMLWLFNMVLPSGEQSHIGRAMALLQAGRFDLILEIIARKLSMNLHLIGVSLWSKVLFAGIFVFVMLVLRPFGALREWMSHNKATADGIAAVASGAVAALAFNDSGIVAAAIMFLYIAVPMLLLRLYDSKPSHSA